MSKKHKKNNEMQFVYEEPADFIEEEILYVDEEGNPIPVDENGNPIVEEKIVYVDEEGNPIPVDENGNPIGVEIIDEVDEQVTEIEADTPENEEYVFVSEDENTVEYDPESMEVIDEPAAAYKEDEIFVPYEDEEIVEEVYEEISEEEPSEIYEPVNSVQPSYSYETNTNSVVGVYGKGSAITSAQTLNTTEPRVQVRPAPGRPGWEEVTYIEYERVLPPEVANAERSLKSNVELINFSWRRTEEARKYDTNPYNDKKYIEYELEQPYGKAFISRTSFDGSSESVDFNNVEMNPNAPFANNRREFNEGMKNIFDRREEREAKYAQERNEIYLRSREKMYKSGDSKKNTR